MRGKARDDKVVENYDRITPAYAGKRYVIISDSICQQDHPRLCGEKEDL